MRAPFLAAWLLLALAGNAAAQVGRVTGTVKDEARRPDPGATIIAENPDASPEASPTARTTKGRFAIIGLPQRPVVVSIRRAGYSGPTAAS